MLPEFTPAQYPEIGRRLVAFAQSRPDRPALFYVGDSELMFLMRFREALDLIVSGNESMSEAAIRALLDEGS